MKTLPASAPETQPNRKKAFLLGDSVPKPLGFTALSPEWHFTLGRLAPPRHSGRWVGAQVASLRCPILRPGEVSINPTSVPNHNSIEKPLAELSRVG